MNLDKLTFTSTDMIKLVGFAMTISAMWWDLKSDMKVHIVEHELLEYRMKKLEGSNLACVPSQKFAIVPRETSIKEEE